MQFKLHKNQNTCLVLLCAINLAEKLKNHITMTTTRLIALGINVRRPIFSPQGPVQFWVSNIERKWSPYHQTYHRTYLYLLGKIICLILFSNKEITSFFTVSNLSNMYPICSFTIIFLHYFLFNIYQGIKKFINISKV